MMDEEGRRSRIRSEEFTDDDDNERRSAGVNRDGKKIRGKEGTRARKIRLMNVAEKKVKFQTSTFI